VQLPPAESSPDATHADRPPGFLGRRSVRVFAVAAASVVAVALAASLAFARSTTRPIGTGIVVVDTNLGYQGGSAAGTGIVLSSSGEILTNNHVIRGATSVKVVVAGHSYAATIVGYDVKDDIAVLKAKGAPSLKTAALGNSSTVRIGSAVVARGNAGGTGVITSASGTVTGLGRTITVSDDSGGSEQLNGLIETNAGLQPGDSGGPLFSGGKVVGVDTAASTGYGYVDDTATDAYAIPINRALTIAHQIESGTSSATVHVGSTAFLGVAIQQSQGFGGFGDAPATGAVIAEVVPNSPAARAGLVAGDVITSIAGRTVTSSTTISNVLLTRKPGNTVSFTYVDQFGAGHSATVVLAAGPAQ
jgi:S1-C subfamily serine protease